MSSEDGRLPPPPPLRSPHYQGLGVASGPLRNRNGLAQPPNITTALTGPQALRSAWSASTLDTPASPYASAGLSPFSQLSPSQSGGVSPLVLRPPASFHMEYNPQQWGRGSTGGGEYRPHGRVAASSGGDALNGVPSPPPPYSPPPSQNTTPGARLSIVSPQGPSEFNSPASMGSMISPLTNPDGSRPTSMHVMSMGAISSQATPAFPPPPQSSRDRSGSRNRPDGQRGLFNLSALTRNKTNERPSGPNAMDALRQNTNDALAGTWGSPATTTAQLLSQRRQAGTASNRSSLWIPPEIVTEPPGSRRSASTGAISNHSDTNSQWEPGMPLPPPPPGPPPSDSRSSSLSRETSGPSASGRSLSSDRAGSSVPTLSMPTRRPPPQRGTKLEPVPPTPADWSEFGQRSPLPGAMRAASHSRERSTSPLPLRIDTTNVQAKPTIPPKEIIAEESSSQPSASSTVAAPPPRESSAKGIRERRSESRAAKDRIAQDTLDSDHLPRQTSGASSAMPADLILTPPSSGISRQGAVKKPRSSMSPGLPKPLNLRKKAAGIETTSTPPFSPGFDLQPSSSRAQDGPHIPPKALPTPPPQRLSNEYVASPAGASTDSKTPQRPESIERDKPPSSAPTSARDTTPQGQIPIRTAESEAFAEASLERYKRFIELERDASTDKERLELFAEFIVSESRLRRDRYSGAFSAMGADIFELTRDLWKSYQPSPTTLTKLSTTSESLNASRKDSMDSSAIGTSPVSRSNFTPRTESESPSDMGPSAGAREGGFWNAYQPVLSPIPSMNVSSAPDEESRGRPSSRWWESSGSRSAGGTQKLERSKRESKYMGVPREARVTLQWQDEQAALAAGENGKPPEKIEFPPEKVGWHKDGAEGPVSPPQHSQFWRHSAPNTPDPHKLDVSRLVTLPPPYPRHYPAMNNNHPDLATARTNLRALTDLAEVSMTKEAFRNKTIHNRELLAEEAADRRRQMRHNIQEQLEIGQMTYASAAEAEAQFNDNEAIITQQAVQKEFDSFQPEVMSPLHALLSERITKSTACIAQLRASLPSADDPSKNQPQEEGDELPELLEKLNLLKWLFDARETLHRELFELENERNDRYREVIIMPFRTTGQEHKITDAEHFFLKDAQDRKLHFIKSRLKRWEEFAKVIEDQVSLGVANQLNAFWDIAPGLLAVVQKVPEDLKGFDVHIPQVEYEENPSYYDYPLQYLYSLLTHAEKATYQFIESQTNLMCLLHEAMTGVMVSGLGLLENQRILEGEEREGVKTEMQEIRRAEEERLTADLKEKVGTVEQQWRDGLGSELEECKGRVEGFLRDSSGWDESLE